MMASLQPEQPQKQQQPIIIIVHPDTSENTTETIKRTINVKAIRGLSITQAVLCGLAFITQVSMYIIDVKHTRPLGGSYFAAPGFWVGIFFGLTAGFGITAAKNKTSSWTICLMVFSILAAVFSAPYLIIASIDVIYVVSVSIRIVAVFHLLISLVGGIAAICLSAFACKAICCRRTVGGTVQYNATGDSAMNLDQIQQIAGIQIPLVSSVVSAPTSNDERAESRPTKYENISEEYGDRYRRFK